LLLLRIFVYEEVNERNSDKVYSGEKIRRKWVARECNVLPSSS
jgi:hypothetical protein